MDQAAIITEISYKAVRSSGAGGQHVNKVASKVIASFNLELSKGLTDREKEILLKKLAPRLTKDGVLQLSAEESRSQFRNKALCTERLLNLLTQNLIRPKVRRATKPTKGSKKRKLKNKKINSEKKALRKKPNLD
ncbi:MAG: aminoacyl-tRNA hydrolase [Crocinitomix sp.]|nr:aminoacyl-tRNA hydrolase [Crocinitomix sp.]